MMDEAVQKRPGFGAGFTSVFSGFGFVLRSPRAWPWAAVPALVLLVTSMLFIWVAIAALRPLVSEWLDFGTSWYGEGASALLSWLAGIAAAFSGVLVSLAITPPLSGPALERIVGMQESALSIPPRPEIGFFAEMWCGVRAQVFAALFAIPLLGTLGLIELFVAPAVFVTTPLKVIVSAFCLAWNLFDYPLTLRNVRMRARFRLVMANKRAALGFGLGFALLFWFPCFGIVMLPVGVAAATRLLWRILAADPKMLPEIPRALAEVHRDAQALAQHEVAIARRERHEITE